MPVRDLLPVAQSRKRGRGKLFKTGPDTVVPPRPCAPDIPQTTPPPQVEATCVTADAATASGAEPRIPIVCPPVDGIFAPGGPVANLLGARYRPREGQVQMATMVREALQTGRHALIEAGTGIGKSFAYLIPILWSGTPGIVSTSNKALMNQLWDKDLPQLRKIAPRPFKAALLKGRANYLCALRLEHFYKQTWLPGFHEDLDQLEAALQQEPSGDCERMTLPDTLLSRLTVSSRECEGQKCAAFKRCFYEQAKQRAAAADVIVTNHALLCHNALLTENRLLDVRPVLVIDEAHQLIAYAINTLTLSLEHDLFWRVINHKRTREAVDTPEVLEDAQAAYADFFQAVARQRPRTATGTESRWALQGEFQEGLALWDALKQVRSGLLRLANNNDDGELDALYKQSDELVITMDALARPEPENYIRFCEMDTGPGYDPRAYHAQRRPLEVAEMLSNTLFKVWPRVICTSATLGINHNLDWFGRQIGVVTTPDTSDFTILKACLDSPFDYKQQMLIYTPLDLEPAYGDAEAGYADKLASEVLRLLECSRGRALVLCTSWRRMQALYQQLAPDLHSRYPCYCQGEMPQPEIVKRFKADGNAIIFATRSFWEGIDIPGAALSLVILDKIPFLPFQDPVVQRHNALIKKRGGHAFQELQLGNAILALRQGAGRLIRTETDRGVIALLDSRIHTRRYGQQIIRSLPPGCFTARFATVAAFFAIDNTSECT